MPIRSELRAQMFDFARQRFASEPVGEMERLGPSLVSEKDGAVFKMQKPTKFKYGTNWAHAEAHDTWRKKNNKGDLIRFDDPEFDRICDLVIDWICFGRARGGRR